MTPPQTRFPLLCQCLTLGVLQNCRTAVMRNIFSLERFPHAASARMRCLSHSIPSALASLTAAVSIAQAVRTDFLAGRLHVRQRSQHLRLPDGQGLEVSAHSLGSHAAVHGEHLRLRPVSSQVQVLPEHPTTHDPARSKRRRSRCRSRTRHHRRARHTWLSVLAQPSCAP